MYFLLRPSSRNDGSLISHPVVTLSLLILSIVVKRETRRISTVMILMHRARMQLISEQNVPATNLLKRVKMCS